MSREKKGQIIDKLEETFSKSTISILTDYRGLTTLEMTALRRKLQEAGNKYKVVKNTLARLALTRAGKDNLVEPLKGPVAIIFGYGDIAIPAKILSDYLRESKVNLSIKGGLLGNRLLSPEEVVTLATLPPKEVLVARVLGQMRSPLSLLVSSLSNPLTRLIISLQSRIQELEAK